MGGKTKQSQRTKNNVRPSSSSRSAELLSNSVTVEGGLVTLGTGKVLPALFPTLAAANFDQGLNPEFQMCIKKLNKKDPVTRTKALQELCELVKKSNEDDVVAILPSWAHFYKTLTIDVDRKVRETTQMCHGAVVGVCGRRAAPQLKRLLPPWLQAQHDDHAPAAAYARAALANTFPDSKLPEVISFCKAEVVAHLLDNLIGNAEAVITKKTENAEEREPQLCRLATSSLQGLQSLSAQLPAAHSPWLWAELAPLLEGAAFWRLASHASPPVRAAWFEATARIVERYKGTFGEKYGVKTLRIVLAAAKDTSSLVASPLWSCLLLIMHNVEGWHTYLDKKDLLVKRILDVLENGGWGDAKHLSNMLLPLLAHLPPDMLTQEFYEAFFGAIFAGLRKKSVLNSKSERQSWITSLAECLRYLSVQPHDFVVAVATAAHRSWLEEALSAQPGANLVKCSAANMASIAKYWLKRAKDERGGKFEQLIRNFWQNVGSTMLAQIDKCGAESGEIGNLIDGHILCLQTLKTSLTQEPRKQHSITFDGDKRAAEPAAEKNPPPQVDAAAADRYRHDLELLVHRVCAQYLEFAEKRRACHAVLPPLMTLLSEFDGEQLFRAVARHFGADSAYQWYRRVLRSWLAEDATRCPAAVDVAFLLLGHLADDEQDAVFDSFQQLPACVAEWGAGAGAGRAARGAGGPRLRAWLRGAACAGALRAAARRAARHGDAQARHLLLACLAHDPHGEALVGPAAVDGVLRELSGAVAEAAEGAERAEGAEGPEAPAALAARLATELQEHARSPHFARLAFDLFRLSVLVPRGAAELSLATWGEVRAAWQEAAALLPPGARAQLLLRCRRLLHAELLASPDTLDLQKLEHMVSLCPYLFNHDEPTQDDVTDLINFTKHLFQLEEHSDTIEMLAVRHECVTSQLNCLDENDNKFIRTIIEQSSDESVQDFDKTDLLLYMKKLMFRTFYLRTILLHTGGSEDEEEEAKNRCDSLLDDEYLRIEFCNAVHDYMVVISLHEAYAFWPHYDILQTMKPKLESLLIDIINSSAEDTKSKILSTLTERAAKDGFHWAYAKRWYELRTPGEQCKDATKVIAPKLEDIVSGTGFFHSLQAEAKFGPAEQRAYETRYLVMLRSALAAHGDLAGEAFVQQLARSQPACLLDAIVDLYYRHGHVMLYDRDVTDAPWLQVVSNACVVEFACAMVSRGGWDAPAAHWDFCTIALCSLLTSLERSRRSWGSTKVAMLSHSVLKLYRVVQRFVADVPAACLQRQPQAHVANLPTEWRDIFAADLHYNLFSVIVHVLESDAPVTAGHAGTVRALIGCTEQMDWELLGSGPRGRQLSLRRLASRAGAALGRSPPRAPALLASALLRLLAEPLVLEDAGLLAAWSDQSGGDDDERPPPQLSLDYLHEDYARLCDAVDAVLADTPLGEEIFCPGPGSEEFNTCLSWLLLTQALADLSRAAKGDLLHHHIRIYRERKYAERQLQTALRLLPEGALRFGLASGAPCAPAPFAPFFTDPPRLELAEAASGADIGRRACLALYWAVCGAGCGGARSWWGAAGVRVARLLERLVRAYVAPHAVHAQLQHLHRKASQVQDAEVRIAWSSSEVTCVYRVEERDIELRVSLSRSHPLAPPRLAAPDAAGPGANTHWLALYLAYQNGTLLNALKMWTGAVNAKVESSPQCYICYCRLHPSTGRLPKVPCHQCHNRFHNSCLRKWFTTSNKSNCPLCRATF